MTDFTPEWIAKARNACVFFGEPGTTEFRKALDEIERLQARVQELEQDLTDQSQKRLENAYVSTNRIIALEGKIRELEQERRWIPVSERLPEGNERIFVYAPPITYPQIATYNHMNKCFTRGNVTHWMLLPQPPEEEE